MISAAFVLLSLAASGLAGSVVHESRGPAPEGWSTLGRHAADAVLPLRFGLAQSNLDKLEEYLLAVSHPESAEYGQPSLYLLLYALLIISRQSLDTGQDRGHFRPKQGDCAYCHRVAPCFWRPP